MKSKLSQTDIELIVSLLQEINDRFKVITNLIPKTKDNNKHFKHLAAAEIHLMMFSLESLENINPIDSSKDFLEKCGCDFENVMKNIEEKSNGT